MLWTILTALATLVSMIAYIITAFYIRSELKGLEKDRYLTVTNELYSLWQSRDFMEAQLWLLHKLPEETWQEFVQAHRGEAGELAFHRVGSFYDRVGTLVRMGLVDEKEILSTIGGYAIAVWQKIGPLVHEARGLEHSTLFDDFERLLPACHECYVPSLGRGQGVQPFALAQTPSIRKIRPAEAFARLERGEALTLLDVRQPSHREQEPPTLPGALVIAPDEVPLRLGDLPKAGEIVAYCT